MSQEYDYIICGAGLSGLSLSLRLADPEFSQKRILLLDKSKKDKNDRTWSFWTEPGNNLFESIYRKSWQKLAFYAPGFECIDQPGSYSYHTINGLDFYNYAFDKINQCDHITFLQTDIFKVIDGIDKVLVDTSSGCFEASYVFDSVVKKFPEKHPLFVWQHFLGWEVALKKGSFDKETATFMDFRIDQEGETRFVYVLPFDEKKALVEATIFSKEIARESDYEQILIDYMSKYVSSDYDILHRELGAIPMTTAKFGNSSKRIICIGTNNATVKPSSGYAFTRIQKESDVILQRIRTNDIRPVKPNERFLAYDRTLLDVLLSNKESGRKVFTMMFQHNKMKDILKFLDEKSSLIEEMRLFKTLPFWSFLKAFVKKNVFSLTK